MLRYILNNDQITIIIFGFCIHDSRTQTYQ